MKKTWILILTLLLAGHVEAQDASDAGDDSEELNIIQVELDKGATPAQKKAAETSKDAAKEEGFSKPIDFQGLGGLAPFSEVSVIQKRFLPKTGRFQAFLGGGLMTNDPYFNTIGGVVKLGYFLSESWGVELNYFALSTSESKAAKELRDINGVNTDSFVITKSVAALDLMWTPIYGKMTWLNETIVPFDLYFSVGPGTTQTQLESAPTWHLATGQIFAISKRSAFRWDFSWNFFNAKDINGQMSANNNLFLTVGWSLFFPEAKYR